MMTNAISLRRLLVLVASVAGFVVGWLSLAPDRNTWSLPMVFVMHVSIVLVSRDSVSRADAKFWPAPLMAGTALATTLVHHQVPLVMHCAALIFWLGLLCASLLRNRRAVLCAVALCALTACAAPLIATS